MWEKYPRMVSWRWLAPEGAPYPTHAVFIMQHEDDFYQVVAMSDKTGRSIGLSNHYNFLSAFADMVKASTQIKMKTPNGPVPLKVFVPEKFDPRDFQEADK